METCCNLSERLLASPSGLLPANALQHQYPVIKLRLEGAVSLKMFDELSREVGELLEQRNGYTNLTLT
jgi:hypothetical protein